MELAEGRRENENALRGKYGILERAPSAKNLPTVSVIIVTFNSRDDIDDCLNSLARIVYPGKYEIIVVDNASSDGVAKYVKERFQNVKVLTNKYNVGFGGACNVGAQFAEGNFLVFLNPDTRVDEAWLSELVKVISSDELIGACSSRILFWNGDKTQSIGGLYNPESGYGVDIAFGETANDVLRKPYKVFYGNGASLIVQAQVFREVEGFDADYFLYFDEVDLCWRIRLLGYEVYVAPKSAVYHRINQFRAHSAKYRFFTERNSLRSIFKNYELKNLFRYGLHSIIIRVDAFVFLILVGKINHAYPFLKGLLSIIIEFKRLWLKRQKVQQKRVKKDDVILKNRFLIIPFPHLVSNFFDQVFPFLE